MASIFDPSRQAVDLDSKIAAALERLSQVFRALLWRRHGEDRLSPIQIQVLVHLRFRPKEGRTVGELAREFQLTPATMSDALAALEDRKLVARKRRSADRRVVHISLTARGQQTAGKLEDWADLVRQSVAVLGEARKPQLLGDLLVVIGALQASGAISLTRMCMCCRFFASEPAREGGSSYYCRLLEQPLKPDELRVDCPEHEALSVTTST